jgi:hypothetical protein
MNFAPARLAMELDLPVDRKGRQRHDTAAELWHGAWRGGLKPHS